MDEEEVACIKVLCKKRGDVIFEGKVSTDLTPSDLVKLKCFRERRLSVLCDKATDERVWSFKGLQSNVELVATVGENKGFSGVLFIGAEDGVLRKSDHVPSCECVMMLVWNRSHEECEKLFQCEMMEDLEINDCNVRQIPKDIARMKRLQKLTLTGLFSLRSLPEEMGQLSQLKHLALELCAIENLPDKMPYFLQSICFVYLPHLQLRPRDAHLMSSTLRRVIITECRNAFRNEFVAHSFWHMVQSTTHLHSLHLDWDHHNENVVEEALKKNGSIVETNWDPRYSHWFERNNANRETVLPCVLVLLAIRRNALKNVPKEMVKMIATMLWTTRCDIEAWQEQKPQKKQWFGPLIDKMKKAFF